MTILSHELAMNRPPRLEVYHSLLAEFVLRAVAALNSQPHLFRKKGRIITAIETTELEQPA
jgi:hypothetical protein